MPATHKPDMPDRNYVRSLTVRALKELGRPTHRDDVIAKAMQLGNFSDAQVAVPPPPDSSEVRKLDWLLALVVSVREQESRATH